MHKIACFAAAAMIAASPAAGQTAPGPVAKDIPSAEATDLNRIECRKEEQIGTRLGAKKVCLTVQEWLSRTRDDRDQLEKGQADTRVRRSS